VHGGGGALEQLVAGAVAVVSFELRLAVQAHANERFRVGPFGLLLLAECWCREVERWSGGALVPRGIG
jgi:hypothetical protein